MVFDKQSIQTLLQILSEYLNSYINKGYYAGVTGAYIDTIMKLDIAIKLSYILINAKDSSKQFAVETYIKADLDQSEVIGHILQWIFINSAGSKSKNSPACEKVSTLCTNIEQFLGKLALSDDTVFKCLPILMRTVT